MMAKLRTSNPLRITTLWFFDDDSDSFLLSLASRIGSHCVQPQTIIHSTICPMIYLKMKQKLNLKTYKHLNFFLISIHDKDDLPLILLKYIKGRCGIKSYDLGLGSIFSIGHMMQLHSFICLFFMLHNLVTSYLSFIRK